MKQPLFCSVLVGVVLASFAGLVFVGSGGIHVEYLAHQDWSRVPSTVPVLYIATVFHNVVPVVTTQLEGASLQDFVCGVDATTDSLKLLMY